MKSPRTALLVSALLHLSFLPLGGSPHAQTHDQDVVVHLVENRTVDASVANPTFADLAITKVADSAVVTWGQTITYTLTVTNIGHGPGNGDPATGVKVTDDLPAGVTFVSASGAACIESPLGHLTCSLPNMAVNASIVFTITVTVGASLPIGSELSNVASVTGLEFDGYPTNNTSKAVSTVDPGSCDLSIAKIANLTEVDPGQTLTYTLTVTNNGPGAALGVLVTDNLPPEVTYISASGANCSENSPGHLSCSLPNMNPGATVVITITVVVNLWVPNGTDIQPDDRDERHTRHELHQ